MSPSSSPPGTAGDGRSCSTSCQAHRASPAPWSPTSRSAFYQASASLLYIAMSDLIPDLHRGQIDSNGLRQVVLIVAGVLTVAVFGRLIGE